MKKISFIAIILFLGTFFINAQEALKSLEEEYYDYLILTDSAERPTLCYKTLSDSVYSIKDTEHIWKDNNLGKNYRLFDKNPLDKNAFLKGLDLGLNLKIYGPEWYNSYNTLEPYGQNDGALWQGKGYNTSLTAGLRAELYGFELTFKPMLTFNQNLEFNFISGQNGNEYSYFVNGIDLVQRYGANPFWQFDWGDSEIRWSWHTLTIGFGTQNPWIGPAWLNPMLGSNNAGSYPKIDIGLRKTSITIPFINWYFGDIEARVWTGRLSQSEYFYDANNQSNYNLLTALSTAFSPSFIPGFTFNFNRIIISRWKTENIKYLGRLFTNSEDNDVDGDGEDQKSTLSIDWLFPKIGFEVYGEIGFDDFTSDKLSNPFHTAIYTLGAKQNIPLPQIKSVPFKCEIILEWSNYEMSQDFQLQWQYIGFYGHSKVKQGYTNNGQILGSGSGYFGNSQFAAIKLYYPKGTTTAYFQRSCPNNNYIYNMGVGTTYTAADAEFTEKYYAVFETYVSTGITTSYFITDSFILTGGFDFVCIRHADYVKNDLVYSFRFCLDLKYQF